MVKNGKEWHEFQEVGSGGKFECIITSLRPEFNLHKQKRTSVVSMPHAEPASKVLVHIGKSTEGGATAFLLTITGRDTASVDEAFKHAVPLLQTQ